MAATDQSPGKLKELIEETERASLAEPAEIPNPQPNHRRENGAQAANELILPVDRPNGSLKLASGERRILIALAQYPMGRSKVQVALLTGYAATGGGFNNYLGALRTRGLIEGDGERL